jgi:hypothetical protein
MNEMPKELLPVFFFLIQQTRRVQLRSLRLFWLQKWRFPSLDTRNSLCFSTFKKYDFYYIYIGRAMALTVNLRPLSAEARVHARLSPYGICGGRSGTGTGFSPSSLISPCQYYSTVALLYHLEMNNRLVGERSSEKSSHSIDMNIISLIVKKDGEICSKHIIIIRSATVLTNLGRFIDIT